MRNDVTERAGVSCVSVKEKDTHLKREKSFSAYDFIIRCVAVLFARAMPATGLAPFGLVFLSMERRYSRGALVSFLLASVGYLSLFDMSVAIKYIFAMLLYEIFLFSMGREEAEISPVATVCAACGAVAVSSVAQMVWNGFSAGGWIRLLCDIVLTGTGVEIFGKNRGAFLGRKSTFFTMNKEEKVCFFMLLGILLVGFKGIQWRGYISALNIAALWLTAMLSIGGGAHWGALCGSIIGLIAGAWENIPEYTAVFALAGAAGGIAAKYGKGAATASVSVCACLFTLFAGIDAAIIFGWADIPVFVMLMVVTPDFAVRVLRRITGIGKEETDEERCREYVRGRLNVAADSLRMLAGTFLDLSDKASIANIEDMSGLFDSVADRVCRECSKIGDCWVSGFNATYKSMLKMLEIAERKGELLESDADACFTSRCLRPRSIVREMNRLFEIYKINCVWKSKLRENRELAGEQLASVAQILDDISYELCEERPDPEAEAEIRLKLASKGIEVGAIDITVSPKGRYSAYIEMPPEIEIEDGRCGVEGTLRSVLGVRMSAVGAVETETGVVVRFTQPEGYYIEAGRASIGRMEESGDNCVMRYLSGGKYAAALSDGMGTGKRASRDSGATVRLLGDFLEAGFDKTIAVRLINSIMVMKSAEEAFATVDMCVIDLLCGDAEFIKNGAEPSYIKRSGRVETVRAASLPVGVMQNMEIESFAHRLGEGDIIVMLSDGLQMKKGYENWIKTMVEDADGNMPAQEMADRIMEMARTLHGGTIEDDMTVMVMKLMKR